MTFENDPFAGRVPMTEEAHARHAITIEAGRLERQYWRDLWQYRELFVFLAWRDILVRYKQTVIGILWALIRPFLTILILTLVFGRIANLPSGNVPYVILVAAATLPWQFFATAISEAGGSLIGNANLITKIYFPRLIIPASSVITSAVDFLISFVILIGFMAWYRVVPGWQFATLPLFTLWALLAALGPGLMIAALNVKYRDFRYVVPFIVQFGIYVSPVGYASAIVTERLHVSRLLYSLNPVVGVIDGFRWAVSAGGETLYLPGMAASLATTLAMLAIGIRYFRSTEKNFADVI